MSSTTSEWDCGTIEEGINSIKWKAEPTEVVATGRMGPQICAEVRGSIEPRGQRTTIYKHFLVHYVSGFDDLAQSAADGSQAIFSSHSPIFGLYLGDFASKSGSALNVGHTRRGKL